MQRDKNILLLRVNTAAGVLILALIAYLCSAAMLSVAKSIEQYPLYNQQFSE